jgi:1,4-dihydroxy-6-naphthoate synthase
MQFRVNYQDVETLNRLSQGAALDVAKISYANYRRCRDEYGLLETGGALGRNCGPLLLAHGERWDPDAEILVPGEFTTANFLLDFYLQRPTSKRFLPFDALYAELLERPGAQGVVIHEKRFTYQADGLTLVQDLGEHWEGQTGYPIPLGAIVTRRSLAIADAVTQVTRRSLAWAYANFDTAFALCREYAQDLDPAVVKAHIDLYVNDFSRDLGPDGRAAIDFFLEQQARFLGRRE